MPIAICPTCRREVESYLIKVCPVCADQGCPGCMVEVTDLEGKGQPHVIHRVCSTVIKILYNMRILSMKIF